MSFHIEIVSLLGDCVTKSENKLCNLYTVSYLLNIDLGIDVLHYCVDPKECSIDDPYKCLNVFCRVWHEYENYAISLQQN